MTSQIGESPPRHVFLSYAYSDRDVAARIASSLRKEGFPIWFSEWELQPGDSIAPRIETALKSSDALLLILSPAAVNSRWIVAELNSFLSQQLRDRAVTVIPVLVEDCEIPASLADRTVVDLRRDFERGLRQLTEQIGALPDIDFARLDWQRFEELVGDVLRRAGFDVVRTSRTRDGGVDFIATLPRRAFADAKPHAFIIEVKHYGKRRVGVEVIREMLGRVTLEGPAHGILVTSAHLTSVAREYLDEVVRRTGQDVRVIDGTALTEFLSRDPQLVQKYFRPEHAE